MHCLVLGGAGFIGSHVVDSLVKSGHKVRVFDKKNIQLENLRNSLDCIELIEGDFENKNDITCALDGVDVVAHLIGTTLPSTSNQNPLYDVETNVSATLQLLLESVKAKIKKIIYFSSGGTVYGIPKKLPIPEDHPTDPLCSYGITKLTIEKYLSMFHHLYNLDYTILRPANPYGMRQPTDGVQGVVSVFLGKTLNDQTIKIWGDGSVSRDYFYIADLIQAYMRIFEIETTSKIFNISSGQSYSINELIGIIKNVTGKKPKVLYEPGRQFDVPTNCLDIRRAKTELDWYPKISLKEGIAMTWDWLKSSN